MSLPLLLIAILALFLLRVPMAFAILGILLNDVPALAGRQEGAT